MGRRSDRSARPSPSISRQLSYDARVDVAYFLAVFSPDTHAAFSASDRRVMGFRERHANAAAKVHRGDLLVAYLTGLSRWVGLLRIEGGVYSDDTPRFTERDDPYVVRFAVSPVVWLTAERGVPIRDDDVWTALSFTKAHEKRSSKWTGSLRTSLAPLKDEDGALLESVLRRAAGTGRAGPSSSE